MSEKSEAQLRNEEAVRKIMAERGYSSASSKKKVEKTFGNNFPFKPFIVGFLVVGALVGGRMLLQDNPLKNEQDGISADEVALSENDEELAKFQTCLGAIDTSEIALDDADFWNKYISRYEQIISCYDSHPSVASLSEKAELQNKLAEFQNNLKSAEANDATYRANMAQIDAELERNLAKIKEESDAWDAELSRRVQERQAQSDERNAQYAREQAERERQAAAIEAQRQQEQAAKKARCDNYKSTYGEKTVTEIAESDSEVLRAKNNWMNAQKKIRNCSGGNIVYNQSQRELCNSYRNQEVQTAELLHLTYINLLQQKTTYYRNLKNEACGY